jgi:protein gp37
MARWIWLQRYDFSKTWLGLVFPVSPDATTIFNASLNILVGSSAAIYFCQDPWLGGLSVAAVAPIVLVIVRHALIKHRKVSEGLLNNVWVNDITTELSVDDVVQFFKLWDAVSQISQRVDK